MKKVIVGVFAHPDDESFGPAGTLILEHEQGTEIHLITLTAGEGGANPDNVADLGSLRIEEWRASGKIIGARSMTHYGYQDGMLNNSLLCEISDKIEGKLHEILADEAITELQLMSFELGGVSGHIDHIVTSRALCAVFYRLKPSDKRLTNIRLFCLPEEWQPEPDIGWIFMDKGYKKSDIEVVDISSVHKKRIEVINAHQSQRGDGVRLLEHCTDPASEGACYDYFVVRN
jgi:LmbE family N-acetylglucosaminyl deacetylase